jgi:hypothetical protein
MYFFRNLLSLSLCAGLLNPKQMALYIYTSMEFAMPYFENKFWKMREIFHFIANIKQIYSNQKRTIQKRMERKKSKLMVCILFLCLFDD